MTPPRLLCDNRLTATDRPSNGRRLILTFDWGKIQLRFEAGSAGRRRCRSALLAQLAEQRILNPRVAGSSPAQGIPGPVQSAP